MADTPHTPPSAPVPNELAQHGKVGTVAITLDADDGDSTGSEEGDEDRAGRERHGPRVFGDGESSTESEDEEEEDGDDDDGSSEGEDVSDVSSEEPEMRQAIEQSIARRQESEGDVEMDDRDTPESEDEDDDSDDEEPYVCLSPLRPQANPAQITQIPTPRRIHVRDLDQRHGLGTRRFLSFPRARHTQRNGPYPHVRGNPCQEFPTACGERAGYQDLRRGRVCRHGFGGRCVISRNVRDVADVSPQVGS